MSHVKKVEPNVCAQNQNSADRSKSCLTSSLQRAVRRGCWNSSLFRTSPTRFVNRLAWRLIVNVNRDFTVDRFAGAECGNEFCTIELAQGRLAEAQIRGLLGHNLHGFQIPRSIVLDREFNGTGQTHRR